MKLLILNIKLNVYSILLRYFLKRKKFKTVEHCLNKKKKLAVKMRYNLKHLNGREVRSIDYISDQKRCVIEYNHYKDKSGKIIFYEEVEQSDFDLLKDSNWTAKTAEIIFKNKKQIYGQASRI